jgi:hypothetical protein
MMRCLQCGSEYPDSQAFCHQCGEPLRPREASADRPATLGKSELAARRARALARRRAPPRSQSLLFAVLVLLGAGVGLALVWRQAWLPSITVSVTRPPDQRSTPAVLPSPAAAGEAATEAAKVEPAAPTPSAPASTAAAAPPAPAAPAPVVEPARPAAPPTAVARAPEPPAPTALPSATQRAPEPATPRAAGRPEPPPPTDRALGTSAIPSPTTPKLLSARTDPAAALPTPGARIISLVPVGSATKARGQVVWEPMGGGTLVVSGLPQPPAGRTYQLWLGSINQGDRVSAGLLAVDAQGAGTLRVAPPRASWSPDIFGVTVERQGGAREPSDDLVLVGEMPKQTAGTPPPASTPPSDGTPPAPGPDKPPATVTAAPVPPTPPPATSTRGPDGQLVRVFSAPVGRTFTVAQSVLRSLGWDIDEANQSTGVIRTEPRNVTYKDFVFYAEGTRQTLSVVVRAVSDTETSISVRREVFQEERILWTKERKVLATPESSVEQSVLDAIDRLL